MQPRSIANERQNKRACSIRERCGTYSNAYSSVQYPAYRSIFCAHARFFLTTTNQLYAEITFVPIAHRRHAQTNRKMFDLRFASAPKSICHGLTCVQFHWCKIFSWREGGFFPCSDGFAALGAVSGIFSS